jgi:uncharacterized membrane protein
MIEFAHLPEIWMLIGVGILSAALVWASYAFGKVKSGRWLKLALGSLRWTAIAAVIFCLLEPQKIETITRQPGIRLPALLDTSSSMSLKDTGESRFASAKNWIDQSFSAATPPHVSVELYSFADSLAAVPSVEALSPTGAATALGDALENLLYLASDDPMAGVVVVSDGIENVRQDIATVARAYRRKGIPIHTVTVGTTNEMRDIAIENVFARRAAPDQAPAKVIVSLRASGFRDHNIPVQVLEQNKVAALHTVRLREGLQDVELEFTPRQKGFQIYEVAIPPQPGEWLATNNRRQFGLEVIDPTIRVIYMEGTPQQPNNPLPEWKYLKDALESDPQIKVTTLFRQFTSSSGQHRDTIQSDPDSGEKIYPVEHPTKGFPRTLAALLHYDVVIHSDIRRESFTPEQLQNMAKLVEQFGGGFIMIGGNSAFGKGGYHRTILDRIIPVAMQQDNDSHARQFKMRVPSDAWSHPLIGLGSSPGETELIWTKKLPTLYGCNVVDRAKPGATVLAVDPSTRNAHGPGVVLAVQNVGKGRSMAFTSDTTRSWGKDFETLWGEPRNPALPLSEANCDSRYYRQFWVNAVRWLAAGRIGPTNNAVTLELAQSYCRPQEKVTAHIRVRDQHLHELSSAEVAILVSIGAQTNAIATARFDPSTRSYAAEFILKDPGSIIVVARASERGVVLGEDRQLLVCEEQDIEAATPRANPQLMADLSRISGGTAILRADAFDPETLFRGAPPVTVEYRRWPIWDKGLYLVLVLGLLSAEWAFRRIFGMA